ncbi:MAG TPA: hypothetical protein VN496_06965, partial [Burkholderiales bacterium]|nr:hypothetical protein [Burkholderiales bacterium]
LKKDRQRDLNTMQVPRFALPRAPSSHATFLGVRHSYHRKAKAASWSEIQSGMISLPSPPR